MASTGATGNAAVVGEFLRRLAERDAAGVLELFAEDAVYEFPFAPPALPNRHEGKAAIARLVDVVLGLAPRIAFADVRIEPLATPGRVLAEFRGDWELADGWLYRNTYLAVGELRAGRVRHWRECYNPLVLQEAFPPAEQ
jgi:uncharacterized protein